MQSVIRRPDMPEFPVKTCSILYRRILQNREAVPVALFCQRVIGRFMLGQGAAGLVRGLTTAVPAGLRQDRQEREQGWQQHAA